jgi:hypothetical protein
MRTYLGKELIFINQIGRDGLSLIPLKSKDDERFWNMMEDEEFYLTCLSLTQKTYIASACNSYIVKRLNETSLKQK